MKMGPGLWWMHLNEMSLLGFHSTTGPDVGRFDGYALDFS